MQNARKLNPLLNLFSFKFETENLLHLFQRKMASTSGNAGKTNRLIHEKSPYLLQHAHNPVDWYPWGDEAFEKAKKDNKMIFLSVGYSTCHWCHVMERESFENEEIGRIMNEHFVSIKVDREERPDVDKMYMGFVQATTGSGGWPMSVWLTPDLKPVVGGTYFAPKSGFGRPGFASVLEHIADKWRENNQAVREQGSKLLEAISQVSKRARSNPQVLENVDQCAKGCQSHYAENYDSDWGGFGDAPKFPQPSNFDFLLRYYAHFDAKKGSWDQSSTLKMVDFTLRHMARGGIHDHIAQGFHRYSTDEKWHVPHFEKMLYDQGQLAVIYAEMYQITKDEFYSNIVDDILLYVDRDLSNKEGGFYSAEDADSYPKFGDKEKKEGAFCVWTFHEIQKLLNQSIGPDKKVTLADIFCKYYLVKPDGNVSPYQDPHKELTNQNVLIALFSYEKVAEEFNLDAQTVKNGLKEAQKILFEARLKRPKPHLDTKMLTAWNGLMISGFAKAAVALKNPEYGIRAEKAIKFIRRHLFDQKSNSLLRSCYADEKGNVVQIPNPIQAFADDYAFFVAGLLDFYDYSHDDQWLKWAVELVKKMDELFWDDENNAGYFQCSTEDKSILIRQKEDQDGAEPSANSVMALNLIRLYNLLNKESYKERAKKIFAAYGNTLRSLSFALPKMMCALLAVDCPSTQIVIVGNKEENEVKEMLNVIHSRFMPFAVTVVLDESSDKWLLSQNEHLKSLQEVNKKPTVFVCSNFSCQLPVFNAKDLEKLLNK